MKLRDYIARSNHVGLHDCLVDHVTVSLRSRDCRVNDRVTRDHDHDGHDHDHVPFQLKLIPGHKIFLLARIIYIFTRNDERNLKYFQTLL